MTLGCTLETSCHGERVAFYQVEFGAYVCDRCLATARKMIGNTDLVIELQEANPQPFAPEIMERRLGRQLTKEEMIRCGVRMPIEIRNSKLSHLARVGR